MKANETADPLASFPRNVVQYPPLPGNPSPHPNAKSKLLDPISDSFPGLNRRCSVKTDVNTIRCGTRSVLEVVWRSRLTPECRLAQPTLCLHIYFCSAAVQLHHHQPPNYPPLHTCIHIITMMAAVHFCLFSNRPPTNNKPPD